jgi:hypothetical protein
MDVLSLLHLFSSFALTDENLFFVKISEEFAEKKEEEN